MPNFDVCAAVPSAELGESLEHADEPSTSAALFGRRASLPSVGSLWYIDDVIGADVARTAEAPHRAVRTLRDTRPQPRVCGPPGCTRGPGGLRSEGCQGLRMLEIVVKTENRKR